MLAGSLFWMVCLLLSSQVDGQVGKSNYPVVGVKDITICYGKEHLILPNPFTPEEMADEKLIGIYWYRYLKTANGYAAQEEVAQLLKTFPDSLKNDSFQIYKSYGLELKDVDFYDTGSYEGLLYGYHQLLRIYNVTVAKAPMLRTANLEVSRTDNKDGTVTLSCGTLAKRGIPPVELLWRSPNGTALEATYKGGNFTLNITKEEAEGTFLCELPEDYPATKCIPDKYLPSWEGTFVFPVKAMSNPTLLIVIAVISSVVGLMIIIFVSILLYRQLKKGDSPNSTQVGSS